MSDKHVDRRTAIAVGAVAAASALNTVNAEPVQQTKPGANQPAASEGINPPPINIEKPGTASALAAFEAVSFNRADADAERWAEIKQRISDELALARGNSLGGELSPTALRIEQGFRFSQEVGDTDFNRLHVEPLIDQAADLLDRGLRDRASWDDLAIKAINLALELGEYAELDAIHVEEEAAGVYDVARKVSHAEAVAESLTASLQHYNSQLVNNLIDQYYSPAKINEQYNAARKSAWLVGLLPYWFNGQNFAGYAEHKWDNVPQPITRWSVDAAEKLSSHDLFSARHSFIVQREVYEALGTSSAALGPGLRAEAEWETQNSNFQRRRTLVARRYQDIKSRISTDPDGILNYAKRMVPLKERFHLDFRSAIARLRVIQEGLATLYGYDSPLPKEGSVDYFDNCLFWTRNAIQWLIRFSRAEQSTIAPVSLKSLLGERVWERGRDQSKWEFTVSEELLGRLAHVRLRGVAALGVGDLARDNLVQMQVRVPTQGRIRHLDGKEVIVDQSKLPAIRFGRVATRQAIRDPDVLGVSALHNASPLGKWRIEVTGTVPSKRNLKELDDLILDLHISYRAVQGTVAVGG